MVIIRKDYILFILAALLLVVSALAFGFRVRDTRSTKTASTIKEVATMSSKANGDQRTTVILAGDIMLGRSVMVKSLSLNNPNYPFEKVASKLNTADIVFVNLENPVISDCPISDSGYKFCADSKMVGGLKYANIGVVNLANNHLENYGKEGLKQTIQYLSQAGIKNTLNGDLEIKIVKGVRFGFMGFNFVTEEPAEADYQKIKISKSLVDILIVAVHWGVEYTDLPKYYQKERATGVRIPPLTPKLVLIK